MCCLILLFCQGSGLFAVKTKSEPWLENIVLTQLLITALIYVIYISNRTTIIMLDEASGAQCVHLYLQTYIGPVWHDCDFPENGFRLG